MRVPRAHAKRFVQSLESSARVKVLAVRVIDYSRPGNDCHNYLS